MHKLTQAGHCQGCHPRGTRAERGPGALPPSVPLRARGRSVRHCGSPFPKGKTDQTHPQNIHTCSPKSFLHQTFPIPSLGMVFPTWDTGESHRKDESKGLSHLQFPSLVLQEGWLLSPFASSKKNKQTHEMGTEKMLHTVGEKK